MDGVNHGDLIRTLRERKGYTQQRFGEILGVSDKTISKWETGRGLPDASLWKPLSKALGISVQELFAGKQIQNQNTAGNLRKSKLYVCPICGNVIHSSGDVSISCCGISLPNLVVEDADASHIISVENIDGEWFVEIRNHSMSKEHYIRFIAYVTSDCISIKRLYPEGPSYCRFPMNGHGSIVVYCNHHGLFERKI